MALLKDHTQPVCFARLCDCYYPGTSWPFLTCHLVIHTCVRTERNLSEKMNQSEATSVDVTNDSEHSNVGEGMINCYGSPVGRIAVSHRSTEFSRTSGEASRVVSSIDFENISQ